LFNIINSLGVMKINNIIRKTRREQGLTQAELARRVGITRPYLSDIENGKRQVRGELMIRIAITLGKSVEDIFLISSSNIIDKLNSNQEEVRQNA
jgi:putative transcriptional regulator